MNTTKVLIFLSLLFCLLGYASSYTGSADGSSTDGAVDGSNPYCDYTDEECNTDPGDLPNPPECSDGKNNNGLWGSDYNVEMWNGEPPYNGDPGCSSPWDDTEASIWDTDLTASVHGLQAGEKPSIREDFTVFFSGELRTGLDIGESLNGDVPPDSLSIPDRSGTGELVERSLPRASQETGKGLWSSTGLDEVSGNARTATGISYYSDAYEGLIILDNGRAVDPPVSTSQVSNSKEVIGNEKTCGNGLTDNGYISLGDINPDNSDRISGTGCSQDNGILTQRDRFSPSYDPDDFKNSVKTDGSCGNTNGNPPPVDEAFEADGDQIIRHYWDESEYETDCSSGDEDPDPTDITEYEKRSEVEFNCNRQNLISGLTGGQDTPNNDQATTLTDMAAYGTKYNSYVWCQVDETLTVDADGPTGNGDGFVVIKDEDKVIGTKSPDGSSSVGKETHYRQSDGSLQRKSSDYLTQKRMEGEWDLECPRNAKYCVKYLDFYTDGAGTGWDQGFESIDSSSRNSMIGEAVSTREIDMQGEDALTPDTSYSVCKFINYINEENGGEKLLDCDYEAYKFQEGEMSPLQQACGDEPDEGLVMAEGTQLDFPVLSKELYQSQACIKFGSDKDSNDATIPGTNEKRDLTRDSCVLGGSGYSIGTVKDVGDFGVNVEAGEHSPDLEVCLNPDDIDRSNTVRWDNQNNQPSIDQSSDLGGEWYDLDNEKVKEYVRDNFDKDAYSSEGESPPDNRIEAYMRENPNPSHPEYNPTGEETGLVMEDDCGSDRFDSGLECQDGTVEDENLFYTFFNVVIN